LRAIRTAVKAKDDGLARQVADPDHDPRRIHDDPAVLETDEGDEEPDADGDPELETHGHSLDHGPPNSDDG
jgi:hypothetical protein